MGVKLVIVGGVAGGASAAARARRISEDAEIVLMERGEFVSFANCGLPYHIAGVIKERKRLLVVRPELLRRRFKIDVRTGSEVVRIDRDRKTVLIRRGEEEYEESYDKLILSPGAYPVVPPIPGVDLDGVFTLRTIPDMDRIIAALEGGARRAIVVGAGFIGLEMVEAFHRRGLEVSLVEMMDHVLPPVDVEIARVVEEHLASKGVDLHLGVSAREIRKNGESLEVVLGDGVSLHGEIVLLAVGVKPESELARSAGLNVSPRGHIVVDEYLRTSDPDIYAVGDAVQTWDRVLGKPMAVPLAGPANRQGRMAADNALGRKRKWKGVLGTAVCKVFDLTVAVTGRNEKALKEAGVAYEKVHLHPFNHVTYYPGARPLSVKMLFSTDDGRVLGAQVVGAEGVAKRIDVFATALAAEMTVFDLEEMELAYAPPCGAAKDAVNFAGMIAADVMRGDVRLIHVDEIVTGGDFFLLDVRTKEEYAAGTIPGAVNIPLDELRDSLDRLPRDKEIVAFCKVGLRAYIACRILQQHGFKCRNLSGGITTYRTVVGDREEDGSGGEQKNDGSSGGDDNESETVLSVDACGLQCPGPVLELKKAIDGVEVGGVVRITASDPAFRKDVAAWCRSTGCELLSVEEKEGLVTAVVKKGGRSRSTVACGSDSVTIVVFSGELDRVLAAFIIATGAASMGKDVAMFFTFWGLSVLRKPAVRVRKSLLEKMFGWMLPEGAGNLTLSRMNMMGMGTGMMKYVMKKKGVPSLDELMGKAKESGVRLIACEMSMNVMGIKPEELVDGVERGGVASFLGHAEGGGVTLFI